MRYTVINLLYIYNSMSGTQITVVGIDKGIKLSWNGNMTNYLHVEIYYNNTKFRLLQNIINVTIIEFWIVYSMVHSSLHNS